MSKKQIQKNIIFKILLFTGIVAGLTGGPFFVNVASAQSCPSSTTVTGAIVNFVGELTDMGGDQRTSVWFEYGQTISYGQKTNENVLTQAQPYCITASGLLPLTTYHYRAAARNNAGTVYGEDKTFTTNSSPAIDIKANGSDGPITIGYNSSAALSWNSSNANSCAVSNAWSGSRNTSGSESTGNLASSRTYTITCTGSGGSVSDSVTVNVGTQGNIGAQKTAANLSDGTAWLEQVYADPGEIIAFSIQVSGSGSQLQNVVVRDVLPSQMKYRGNLKVDNVITYGDIIAGLDIGFLSPGQTKTITFEAEVLGKDNFNFGETRLTNSITVSGAGAAVAVSDTAQVVVTRSAVAGAATSISTGITDNLFFDSFLLPLVFALIMLWLLKSRILKFEEWKDKRAKEYQKFRAAKTLDLKIAKIKATEFLQKRII